MWLAGGVWLFIWMVPITKLFDYALLEPWMMDLAKFIDGNEMLDACVVEDKV